MKDFNNFKAFLMSNIKKVLPDDYQRAVVEEHEMTTASGRYTGLIVKKPEQMAAPTVNLNKMYEFYETHTLEEVLDMAAEIVQMPIPEEITVVTEQLEDYGFVKNHLILKVVSAAEDLADKIYQTREDLAIIPYVQLKGGAGENMATAVTESLLATIGISKEQLFKDCFENAPKLMPAKICTMGEFFEEMGFSIPGGGPEIYVISNAAQLNGAATLFYPGVMEEMAERLGGSYYVLPSSKHEMLAYPDNSGIDASAFIEMVTTINGDETAVSSEDKLIDSVYKYDAESKIFSKVA